MNHEQVLEQLRTSARALFPAECDIDDVVQEAVAAAYSSGAAPEALLDAADAQLRELRTQHYWKRRRIAEVRLEQRHENQPSLATVRRKQSRNRRPAGVLGAKNMRGTAMVTLGVGETPTAEVQLAAHLLSTIDLPRIAYGEPYTAKAGRILLGLLSEFYGVASPRHHWATVLLDEIEQAKLQHLQSQDPNGDEPGPETPGATFTRSDQDQPFTMQLEAEAHETVPGRGVIHYFGMVEGKRTHFGTMVGSLLPKPHYPTDPIERSLTILINTRLRLCSMDPPLPLPAFADDPVLVRWLFIRTGFAGGGGPDAVKRTTLLSWLQDPKELGRQILAYARRRAQGGTDEEAEKVEDELSKLATRIRSYSADTMSYDP